MSDETKATRSRLQNNTTRELLSLFAEVMQELRDRGAVRSSNNPVADYAEALVAKALSLRVLAGSTTGCDAVGTDGKRYEVKGRRVTRYNKSTQLSVVRGLEKCHFDYLAGVLFDEQFSVTKACLVPHELVRTLAKHRPHVNGWILFLRSAVWEETGVIDITKQLQRTQARL